MSDNYDPDNTEYTYAETISWLNKRIIALEKKLDEYLSDNSELLGLIIENKEQIADLRTLIGLQIDVTDEINELQSKVKLYEATIVGGDFQWLEITKIKEVLLKLIPISINAFNQLKHAFSNQFESDLLNASTVYKSYKELLEKLDVGSASARESLDRQTECEHEWVNTTEEQIRCDKCDQLKTEKKEAGIDKHLPYANFPYPELCFLYGSPIGDVEVCPICTGRKTEPEKDYVVRTVEEQWEYDQAVGKHWSGRINKLIEEFLEDLKINFGNLTSPYKDRFELLRLKWRGRVN